MSADPYTDLSETEGAAVAKASHEPTLRRALFVGKIPRSIIAALVLLICTNGPSNFLVVHVFKNSTWPSLYLFAAVAIAGPILLYQQVKGMAFRHLPMPIYPIAGFCVVALVSASWTVSPSVTPLAALLGTGIAAFGCWYGWFLTVREHITSLVVATALATGLSLLVIVLRPDLGHSPSTSSPTGYGPDWIGIYGNRNSLAAVGALGVLAFVGFVAVEPTLRRALIGAAGAAVQFLVVWFSGGDTSLIALVSCMVAAVLVPGLWKLRKIGVPGSAVVVAGLVVTAVGWHVVFANIGTLTSAAGRSPMLSSRRVIWADVRGFIRARPYLGYGYWGLWDRPDLTADTYSRVGAWYGSAHNSGLEVLIMLGVVGLVFYLQVCVQSVGGVLRSMWLHKSVATWWWTLLVVYLIVENLTESFVLWHSYNWILFIGAGFVALGPNIRSMAESDRLELQAQNSRADNRP